MDDGFDFVCKMCKSCVSFETSGGLTCFWSLKKGPAARMCFHVLLEFSWRMSADNNKLNSYFNSKLNQNQRLTIQSAHMK